MSVRAAVEQGIRKANGETEATEAEKEAVKKLFREYSQAREFDKTSRQRYTRDRRYAAGTANKTWASDANIIGAYIDILIGFIYAKDPDVSARPAAQVAPPPPPPAPLGIPTLQPPGAMPGAPPIPGATPGGPLPAQPVAPVPATPTPQAFGGEQPAADPLAALAPPGAPPALPVAGAMAQSAEPLERQDAKRFAETAQIVVSKQWKRARLKHVMKRVVRSSLSVGPGWFKSYMYSEQGRNPKLEKELSDARDNLERIEKLQNDLTGLEDPPENPEAVMEELKLQIAGLEKRVELLVKRGLCIDFIRAEDIQVSLDVASTEDYLAADWVSHDIYVEKETAKSRFPRLSDDDIKRATEYVQRETGKDDTTPIDGFMSPNVETPEGSFVRATDVNQGTAQAVIGGKEKPIKFLKVVELWDHRDMNIKTMVDGVDTWAVEPYPPEHASSRFYPFFRLALYEVDGSRHPQSLSDRMWKLQDEYSSRRSSGRKTRERSIPGTIFNSGELDPTEAKKLEDSTEMEYVGVRTTTVGADINKVVGAKPVPRIDPAIYDTKDILYDMNVISGVQEAQASGNSDADTATEADIQQSGFASRTSADRDTEEEMLNDFAQYTLEISVQGLKARDVQRLAGPFAFWPEGMDVEDILTLVEIEIMAGTTGKPRAKADKETWATLLPLILDMYAKMQLAFGMGDMPAVETYKNIINETIKRLDDRLSIDDIIVLGAVPPVAPGLPGAPPTAAPGGAAPPPATGNGTVNKPPEPAAA